MKFRYILLIALFFSCSKSKPGTVVIHSAITNTSVTLVNNSDSTVNLDQWFLEETYGFEVSRRLVYTFTSTSISKGATLTITSSTLGFVLNKNNTLITLYDPKGNKISELSGTKFK